MPLDRADRDHQSLSNLLIGSTGGYQLENLQFPLAYGIDKWLGALRMYLFVVWTRRFLLYRSGKQQLHIGLLLRGSFPKIQEELYNWCSLVKKQAHISFWFSMLERLLQERQGLLPLADGLIRLGLDEEQFKKACGPMGFCCKSKEML